MSSAWIPELNARVLAGYRARLVGGFDEPLYLPATATGFAQIRFTRNYERSALHELAHWAVAGKARRELEDYGYWYVPDGRNAAQQRAFFKLEVRPQAIEKCFCSAVGIPFDVSVDNLDGEVEGLAAFRTDVAGLASKLRRQGLPQRANAIYRFLGEFSGRSTHQ
jgi:elongation factor P hydroxylase